MSSTRDCQALKFFLSLLYKLAALGGLTTIVVTLDVTLSLAVIVVAFSIYYLSRAIVGRICPNHARDEHKEVLRNIRPGSSTRQTRRKPTMPIYTGNVTPLRRGITPTADNDEATPISVRIRNR